MSIKPNNSGQVALVMVLIMTVVSAVAVSIAGRSTVETRVQEMVAENREAVLTAQAGLEEAISLNASVSGSLNSGSLYDVSVVEGGSSNLSSGKINPGEVFEVNLIGSSGVTDVNVYWKAAVTGTTPAVFISDVRSDRKLDYAYDGEGINGFTRVTSGGTLSGVSYSHVTPSPITISGSSLSLRIAVLGAPAFLAVEPIGGVFPPQSTNFKSVASLGSGDTSTKYGLEYVESKTSQLPTVFDYVLFSGGTIVQ